MSVRSGPLGNLRIPYAVACAYRPTSQVNKQAIRCKFCGEAAAAGEAMQYAIADISGPYASTAYLCRPCGEWVEGQREEYVKGGMA